MRIAELLKVHVLVLSRSVFGNISVRELKYQDEYLVELINQTERATDAKLRIRYAVLAQQYSTKSLFPSFFY